MNKRRVDYLKGETLPLEIILKYKYGTSCRNQTHSKRVGSSCAIITPRTQTRHFSLWHALFKKVVRKEGVEPTKSKTPDLQSGVDCRIYNFLVLVGLDRIELPQAMSFNHALYQLSYSPIL